MSMPVLPFVQGKCYMWHDGPVIYDFTDAAGRTFFALSVEDNESELVTMCVLLENSTHAKLVAGQTTLREAFDGTLVETVYVLRQSPAAISVSEIAASNTPDDWLSSPGASLDPDEC